MVKFEIYTDKNDKFKFRLKTKNEQILLVSGDYCTKIDCLKGVESVKLNSIIDARYERLISKGRNPYFNLKSFNNQIIGTSEIYNSVNAMENGISIVKEYASDAFVRNLIKISS